MRSSTWREQAGMREQIGAEDPSKGGRDAPNRLGWHQGRRRPSGERRRRVALQKWLNCRPIRATAPCARRSLVVGAPPATATATVLRASACGRRPERPQPDQVVDHADDGSSAARGAGRSGPRAQRPIPSPCSALSASLAGRLRGANRGRAGRSQVPSGRSRERNTHGARANAAARQAGGNVVAAGPPRSLAGGPRRRRPRSLTLLGLPARGTSRGAGRRRLLVRCGATGQQDRER